MAQALALGREGYCYAAGMAKLGDGNFFASAALEVPKKATHGGAHTICCHYTTCVAHGDACNDLYLNNFLYNTKCWCLWVSGVNCFQSPCFCHSMEAGWNFIYKHDHEEMIMQEAGTQAHRTERTVTASDVVACTSKDMSGREMLVSEASGPKS